MLLLLLWCLDEYLDLKMRIMSEFGLYVVKILCILFNNEWIYSMRALGTLNSTLGHELLS